MQIFRQLHRFVWRVASCVFEFVRDLTIRREKMKIERKYILSTIILTSLKKFYVCFAFKEMR